MQFVLMILRLVLGVLFPSSRDGLSLAARPDGRVEHVPRSAWDWLLGPRHDGGKPMRGRAGTEGARGRRHTWAAREPMSGRQLVPLNG